jgi:cation:H+ antiporter
VWILNFARKHPRWKVIAEGSAPGRRHHREKPAGPTRTTQRSLRQVATLFGAAAAITLGAGVLLEVSGSELAARAHIDGVVFGATVLSLATALPEISSGIEAVRLGDHQLAVADVFGGNAFQLTLFLVADLVAQSPALPSAGPANAWLGGLAIAITVIYVTGIIIRPARPNRLGPDSILALAFYAIGIVGLLRIAG